MGMCASMHMYEREEGCPRATAARPVGEETQGEGCTSGLTGVQCCGLVV